MARDQHEAEDVVADRVIECRVEVVRGLFGCVEFTRELLVFAPRDGVTAEEIDGASFRGGCEPCRGIIGNAGLRPLLECGEKRLLCKIFSEADVASEAGESADDARRLDAPDRVDSFMQGVM